MVVPDARSQQRGCSGVQGSSVKGVFLRRLGLNFTSIPSIKISDNRCFSTLCKILCTKSKTKQNPVNLYLVEVSFSRSPRHWYQEKWGKSKLHALPRQSFWNTPFFSQGTILPLSKAQLLYKEAEKTGTLCENNSFPGGVRACTPEKSKFPLL